MTNFSAMHLHDMISKIYHDYLSFRMRRYISRIKRLHLRIYLLHGMEKQGRSNLTILFLGDHISLSYLSNILYAEKPRKKLLGKIFICNIRKKLNLLSKKADMVFVETDRFFSRFLQKKGFIIIPEWIEMKLDISEPLAKIYEKFTSSAKKDIRTIKKYGYSYEISTDPNKLDFFYHEMCIPYMSKRYGELILPDAINYHDIKRNFEKGKLLLVKDRDKYIAGSVISIHGKTAYPVYMGLLEDYYLKRGAGAALYYFPIVWAKENGLNLIDFGNTRTFLNKGAFQYKRKWSMTVHMSKLFFEIFGFKICNYKAKGVSDFLGSNPFIYIDNKQLKVMVFLHRPVTCDEIQQLWKKYYTLGLSKISVISTQDFDKEVKAFVTSNYRGKIVLLNKINNID